MNTTTVAKKIGVSPKTVQRWIKQLKIPMERNELGHYIFTEEDIQLLQFIHEQILKGVPIKDLSHKVPVKKEKSEAKITSISTDQTNKIWSKIKEMELMIYQKADDVVSYQLLQHRKEMEELQNRVTQLEETIKELEKKQVQKEKVVSFESEKIKKPRPLRKGLISSIFGL